MAQVVYLGPSPSVVIPDPDRDAVYVADRDVPVDVPAELAVRLLEQTGTFAAPKPKTQAKPEPKAADAADKDTV